jgi:hypothetical protein
MYRQRAEYHGRDDRECAVDRSRMQSSGGLPRKGTRMKVQTGFRRYLAHGRSPTPHKATWNTVCGWIQDDMGNSDSGTPADSCHRRKFSTLDSGENFIRSDLKRLEPVAAL